MDAWYPILHYHSSTSMVKNIWLSFRRSWVKSWLHPFSLLGLHSFFLALMKNSCLYWTMHGQQPGIAQGLLSHGLTKKVYCIYLCLLESSTCRCEVLCMVNNCWESFKFVMSISLNSNDRKTIHAKNILLSLANSCCLAKGLYSSETKCSKYPGEEDLHISFHW